MKTAIKLINTTTGRKVLITTAFTAHTQNKPKYAYIRDFGQQLKCVAGGHMHIVNYPQRLPVQMFGKRTGPFYKLQPAEGWEILGTVAV